MKLQALEAHLTVCKVAQVNPEMLTEGLCFVARTDEELSLVCETRNAPAHTLAREDGWRAFRVVGELDFSLVGILARLSAVLSFGTPGAIRTHGLQSRSLTLYPAELRAHVHLVL